MRLFVCLLIGFVLRAGTTFADDAEALYKQGLQLKQQGKADDAIQVLAKVVAANPQHGMAWVHLGSLYKAKGDFPRAVDAYEKASAIIRLDANLWANLGMAYYRNKQRDKAVIALSTASRLAPNDAEIRSNLGTIKRQTGDFAGAIVDLEVAVKLVPRDGIYHNNLGMAYRSAGRDDDALKAFKKAAELLPNDATLQFNLGVAYRRKEIFDQAARAYEAAAALDPRWADVWFDLGVVYKQLRANDKALAAFKKFLGLYKDNDPAVMKLVNDAIGDLGKPNPETPKQDATVLKLRAMTHYKQGRAHERAKAYGEAAAEYEAAYAIDKNAAHLFNIGEVHRLGGQPTRATEAYKRYLAADANGVRAADAREQIASLTKQHEQAVGHFKQGEAHFKAKAYRDAVVSYEAGLVLEPWPPALYNIGESNRLDGKRQKAIEAYQQYIDALPAGPRVADARRYIDELTKEIRDGKP